MQYDGDNLTFDAENYPNDNCTFAAVDVDSTGHHILDSTQNGECWKDCQKNKDCIAWLLADFGELKSCTLYKYSFTGTLYWSDGVEGQESFVGQ